MEEFKSPIIEALSDLAKPNVPRSMATVMAIYTLARFVGMLQVKLRLSPFNTVPINVVAFIMARSGAGKTSTERAMRKAFEPAYAEIEKYRKEATKLYCLKYGLPERSPTPLTGALSTGPGISALFSETYLSGIGAPTLIVDEIASELKKPLDLQSNFDILAIMYDNGDLDPKVIKDAGGQIQPSKCMPFTALFMGAEHALMEDQQVLKAFVDAFVSALARRTFFCNPDDIPEPRKEIVIEDIVTEERDHIAKQGVIYDKLQHLSVRMTKTALASPERIVDIGEAEMLYIEYRETLALNQGTTIFDLEYRDRAFKALKLAGALAAMDGADEIKAIHYKQAQYYVNYFVGHLERFMKQAEEPMHEKLIRLLRNRGSITEAELVKLKMASSKREIDELIHFANSKLGDNAWVEKNEEIELFEHEEPTEYVMAVKATANLEALIAQMGDKQLAKQKIAKTTTAGFQNMPMSFDECKQVLNNDVAFLVCGLYPPTDDERVTEAEKELGYRKEKYTFEKTAVIALDIDGTGTSFDMMAQLLKKYKYHMAMTSDPNNRLNYRVLLFADVDIPTNKDVWTFILSHIEEETQTDLDKRPPSQFYYGFKGREILTNEGENYPVRTLINQMNDIVLENKVSPTKKKKKIQPKNVEYKTVERPPHELKSIYRDRKKFFSYGYELDNGDGPDFHLGMFHIMQQMTNLGFGYELAHEMLTEILHEARGTCRPEFFKDLMRQQCDKYAVAIDFKKILLEEKEYDEARSRRKRGQKDH